MIVYWEKRSTTDLSESEKNLLGLGAIAVFAIIALIYMSIIGAIILITINCGALFRNHGKKFFLCLIPVYNIYLCSKLLMKKGWYLLCMLFSFLLPFYFVTGTVIPYPAVNILCFIFFLIINMILTGYFNHCISKIAGATGAGYGMRRFLDWCPVISWIVFAVFLVKDMGKY